MAKNKSKLTLEDRIARAEQRITERRARLSSALVTIDSSTREAASSPKFLIGALAAGFVIGRIAMSRGRGTQTVRVVEKRKRAGVAGLVGTVALALVRTALTKPDSWVSHLLREAWRRGRAAAGTARPQPAVDVPPAAAARPARSAQRARSGNGAGTWH